jgi:hypothetical protein
MGFAPADVDAMSLWQFLACLDGWKAANGVEEPPEPPSADEFHDMVSRLG